MDALTSQALVAGYRCVLEAAMRLPRFFPLFMTAAGTVPPAKVLVLGAGVAGLQAIATAKRLGAVVSAYDVRPASADEVAVDGRHLRPPGPGVGRGQRRLRPGAVRRSGRTASRSSSPRYVAAADVLITTAAIPGRRAPLLVTAGMLGRHEARERRRRPRRRVRWQRRGHGGRRGPGVDVPGGAVRLVGMQDAPSTMPVDASRLYAKNVTNLLLLMTKDGLVIPDFDDEVVAGTCLTHGGEVRHAPTAELLAAATAGTGGGGAA